MNHDNQKGYPHVQPDKNAFMTLAQATTPFRKYSGRRLVAPPATPPSETPKAQ
jgi:hypothetical protein